MIVTVDKKDGKGKTPASERKYRHLMTEANAEDEALDDLEAKAYGMMMASTTSNEAMDILEKEFAMLKKERKYDKDRYRRKLMNMIYNYKDQGIEELPEEESKKIKAEVEDEYAAKDKAKAAAEAKKKNKK